MVPEHITNPCSSGLDINALERHIVFPICRLFLLAHLLLLCLRQLCIQEVLKSSAQAGVLEYPEGLSSRMAILHLKSLRGLTGAL